MNWILGVFVELSYQSFRFKILFSVRNFTYALQQVRTSVLTPANGYRGDVPNWVISVTTGSSLNPLAAEVQARLIDQMVNTTRFAIGIGNAVSLAELNILASSAYDVFRFNYSDLISGFAEKFICSNLVIAGELFLEQRRFSISSMIVISIFQEGTERWKYSQSSLHLETELLQNNWNALFAVASAAIRFISMSVQNMLAQREGC